MNSTASALDELNAGHAVGPMYRIVLNRCSDQTVERMLRQLIARKGGEFRWLAARHTRRPQLHLGVGPRRIDDVIAALDAAGYDVGAVILTCAGPGPGDAALRCPTVSSAGTG